MHDPDAPTVLAYARSPFVHDYDGTLLDDDCDDAAGDPDRVAEPWGDDPDVGGWRGIRSGDCEDGAPDGADYALDDDCDIPW